MFRSITIRMRLIATMAMLGLIVLSAGGMACGGCTGPMRR
jgi:hypothetical protein